MAKVRERAAAVVTSRGSESEFLALAEEAGYDVVEVRRVRRVTTHILSEYRLEQLRRLVKDLKLEAMLFDLPLKPKQAYNIAKALAARPIDRIEVILSIFLKHAPTKEAKLQVKLASLRYELARAKEKVRLAKLGEQPGFYGLGAYEVDLYYNDVRRRISKIAEKLRLIRSRRGLHRDQRTKRGHKTVSITGYTCSGKTTLFNALTGLLQRVGDEPFTTLSTKFARLSVGPWKVYLVDTIGFINDLPPFMIHAFRSTLEEVSFADVVFLVVDASDPPDTLMGRFKTAYNQLIELDVIDKPLVAVVNKIDEADGVSVEEADRYIGGLTPYVVNVSALKGDNLEALTDLLEELLGDVVHVEFTLPFSSGDSFYTFMNNVKEGGRVEGVTYSDEGTIIETMLPRPSYRRLSREVGQIGGAAKIVRREA